MKRFWTIRLLLAITLFRQEAFAVEGDVYNFYFQKAPGPTTVIQGGGKPENSVQVRETPNGVEVIQPNKETAPAPAQPIAPAPAVTAEKEKEKEPDLKKWAFRVGLETKSQDLDDGSYDYYGYPKSLNASGTAVGATYAFNKYLALDATVLFASSVSTSYDTPSSRRAARGVYPFVGLEFTPIRIVLFNYDLLDFSLMAGFTTRGLSTSAQETDFYRGVKFGINLSSNFTVQALARFSGSNNSGEGGMNVVWRF